MLLWFLLFIYLIEYLWIFVMYLYFVIHYVYNCYIILLYVMYKSLHNLFYCKNYVVSNVVSSHILCFIKNCHYKIQYWVSDSTGNVKFMYIQLFQKSMFWYVWHQSNTQTWSYMLTNLEWICNLKVTYRKRFRKNICVQL